MKIYRSLSAITLFFSSLILFASCSGDNNKAAVKKDNPVQVTVSSPEEQSNNKIYASGRIESRQTAVISTRVMGFITSIKVKVGDKVQKGELLATISNADIVAKKGQAQAMVSEAEAALKDAQKDYERFAKLYEQQSASAKEFENATLYYNSAKSKTEAAKQMQKEADAMLTYTILTAPFSGVVTQQNIDAGSMANPGMPILVMEQTENYQVSASISEDDIAHVKAGSDAEIVIKSSGRKFKGEVSEVSPSSQFSGGQYLIKVNIPNTDKSGLYSGMVVNVAIDSSLPSRTSDSIILVPASAVVYIDQLTGLYTIGESHTALLRWVKLGKSYGDDIEILSGLRSDEKFIIKSEDKLYNGLPVTIK